MTHPGPEVLAVVQARAGSKGVPGKNIRPLLGKPLLSWIIESARGARGITRLILSTDSQEYARIGREYWAETPFLRPPALASDAAADLEVMTHALGWLKEKEGYQPEIVLRLQPTNPTFPTELIDEGIRLLMENPEADSVRPITDSPKHPYKMWRPVAGSPYIQPLMDPAGSGFKEPFSTARQLLPPAFVQVGAMEVVRTEVVLAGSMAGKKVLGLWVQDPLFTVNIDSELDFLAAEQALKILNTKPMEAGPLGHL